MCRARPGPRCSNSGLKRVNAARRNVQQHQDKCDEFAQDHPDEPMPDKLTTGLADARLRLEAANNVFYATPAGQKELGNEIKQLKDELPKRRPPASKASQREKYDQRARMIELKEKALSNGIDRRMNSYEDYHEFINERPITRQESINRGSDLNPQAQKNRSGKDFTNGEPTAVELPEFSDAALSRASTWVEAGTEYIERGNTKVKPAKKIGDMTLGEKQADADTKLMRMSLPDGTIAEARHDLHITKNDAGKYVVSVRSTVATSFEDASPIDRTTHEMGHLLKHDRGKTVDHVIGEYSSLSGAKTRRGMIINESGNRGESEKYDFAKETAQIARGITQHRFGHVTSSGGNKEKITVQKRGLNTVDNQRYARVDDTQETGYEERERKAKERRQQRKQKAMDKALADA